MSTSITLEGFYRKAGKLIPWFMSAALVLFVVGVYLGFFVCPIEARQGNSYRIIFIHIPAAWLAMSLYLLMAVASIVGLLKNSRLAFILAQAMAPTGALMGFIALFSGAFWGRPTWGTYWVWDARLTSMLILFFLYLGFIALHSAIDDKRPAGGTPFIREPPLLRAALRLRRSCSTPFSSCWLPARSTAQPSCFRGLVR